MPTPGSAADRISGGPASRGAAEELAGVVSLAMAPDEPGAEIRLSWRGEPMSVSVLERTLAQPLDPETDTLTGREVLDRHGSEIWPEWDHDGNSWLTIPIHAARPVPSAAPPKGFVPERNAVYDFDLLAHTDHAAVDATPLSRLTYVIFDTETTGLDPNGGDEIVQIAALRAVNGRLVPGEVIDQLVDPGRRIPPGSTKIHGITDEMVQGQPGIAEAGAYFHRFAHRAVLVAHNAPFDMAFFHRHAPAIGAAFDNPVLDTVLLSAILFGQQEEHTLDALAARFGVTIPEEARHTALGDTQATAEVFLRMIPMLEAKGLRTFGDVLDAMARNSRLMREMTARVGA
ncbi:3'-5' exonuclease [Mangrovicoccus ximenensis]|uniref:3'-5' exonuclease n=1 Tax=Mangrovicoccus ximenensis TaxID=1911570 RepID=UPI001F38ED5A|nr:3'-5' exonuclease [Mangrovicoccus ximenensis]